MKVLKYLAKSDISSWLLVCSLIVKSLSPLVKSLAVATKERNGLIIDIYVIKDDLGKQILLPSTKEIIKQIDVENDRIVVHLIDGLV